MNPYDNADVRFLIKRLALLAAGCTFVGFIIGAVAGKFWL
jgi:hypothetical protein